MNVYNDTVKDDILLVRLSNKIVTIHCLIFSYCFCLKLKETNSHRYNLLCMQFQEEGPAI